MKKFIIHKTKSHNFMIFEVNADPQFEGGILTRYIIKSNSHDYSYNVISRLPYSVEAYAVFDTAFDAESHIISIYPKIKEEQLKSIQYEIDFQNKKLEKLMNKKVSIRRFKPIA